MTIPADLAGRTAVITGASRGLGAGLARAFAARGMRLGLCSRSAPALDDGPRVVSARVDVRDADALDAFVRRVEERLGAIDLWVGNAAVLQPIGPLRDAAPDALRAHLDTNVLGVALGTAAFARHRRRHGGGGVLVNVSSGAARTAYEGWGAYCASKAAVERLTEVVALEEAASGLRAHSVSPGIIDTDMQAAIRAASPEAFPLVERFRGFARDGAFSTPEHVAGHLLALAFDPEHEARGSVTWRVPAEGGRG